MWISDTYLTNAIGSAQVTALGLTAASARLVQYELNARARVISALQHAGYSSPGDTLSTTTAAEQETAAFYQQLACAALLSDAYAFIPGIDLPQQVQAAINRGLNMIDAVYDKRLPVPNVQPDGFDGIGGTRFNTDPQYQAPTTSPVFRSLRGSSF